MPRYLSKEVSGSQAENSARPPELSDPRAMRALAHPLRLTLLELVSEEGTLTATRAAELTGEHTASCSFHLRQLAKYGFIEEASGAVGRERPWKLASAGFRWAAHPQDDEAASAADALTALLLDRDLRALRSWLERRRADDPEWRDAALTSRSLLYLTQDELRSIGQQLIDLQAPYLRRTAEPSERPSDSVPVNLLAFAFPILAVPPLEPAKSK